MDMKRRFFLALLTLVTLTLGMSQGAFAKGNSPGQLAERGWLCIDPDGPGPLTIHCFPPGTEASSATMTVKVFDTLDPADEDAAYLGNEILLRADLYRGQPCPQNGLDHYEPLDLTGDGIVDYFACHFYETDHD
jgi:hypothetical protein